MKLSMLATGAHASHGCRYAHTLIFSGIHKNQLGDILINSAKDRLQIFCIPDAIIPVCERLRTVNNVPVSCRTVDLDFEFMKEDRFDRSKYSSEDYDN
eukprot:1149455-Amorphochlora_amoeboformis.AAC.1